VDTKDWKLLKALREYGTAVKTAEKLFLSQPAVTYRLKRMESETGAKLFIKSNKGILFTSAGERLLSHADRMLRQHQEILERVKLQDGIVSGTIHLGAPPYFASRYLPALIREFSSMYPEVTLRLYSGLSSELIELLRREEVLICVVRGEHVWNGETITILQETIKVAAAQPLALEDLPRIPFIGYRTDPYLQGQIDHWWWNNFSTPRNMLIHTFNSSSCIRFIKEGLGFSLIPSMSIDSDDILFNQTITNNLGEPYIRPTRLLYHPKVQNFDTYTVFIDFFIKKWQELTRPDL
jgi:DNA-binding transcriptional LysR family regulator